MFCSPVASQAYIALDQRPTPMRNRIVQGDGKVCQSGVVWDVSMSEAYFTPSGSTTNIIRTSPTSAEHLFE